MTPATDLSKKSSEKNFSRNYRKKFGCLMRSRFPQRPPVWLETATSQLRSLENVTGFQLRVVTSFQLLRQFRGDLRGAENRLIKIRL